MLQSLVAAADTHQTSHSGPEHVTAKHQHLETQQNLDESNVEGQPVKQQDLNTLVALNDLSEAKTFDCHHCCHGASSIHYYPAPCADQGLITGRQSAQFDYHFYTLALRLPPEDRPPIA